MLSIAVLRATFIETPHIESPSRITPLSNEAISLLLSAALLAAPVAWWMLSGLAGRRPWRRTYCTGAIGVFCALGLAGACFASDKRAALTDWAVLISGPAAGLLAVQLFDRKEKVRLFLWLLLAVAAAATYTCYDKMASSNAQIIGEYEKNPAAMLATLGIEPGSLQQWQYEHRLYSRDVSGFLTTSNSAGSFFLLAVFAGIGLCIEAFRARGNEATLVAMICAGLATAAALAGLMMTQSKGALVAFAVFAAILAICVMFRTALWKFRTGVCAALAVFVLAAVVLTVAYGVRHGRLPGGNSMLVRWQYWVASLQIAQEHPVLGVGGGNFVPYYMLYKNPAAPETISDPHNWALSILCRFGLAGLATMGWAMLRPVGRMFGAALKSDGHGTPCGNDSPYGERFLWLTLLAGVMVALLSIRPGIFGLAAQTPSANEYSAAFLLLFAIPASIVALVFGVLRCAGAGDASLNRPNTALIAAIACGLGAVLLHNLVDFALFEPGVWTMFWLLMAAGLALADSDTSDGGSHAAALNTSLLRRVVPAAVYGLMVLFVVVPPVRRGVLIYRAVRSPAAAKAETLLQQAVAVDTLSPDAAVMAARLLMQYYEQRGGTQNPTLPQKALAFAEIAVARTPADPRPRRLMGDILLAAAQQTQNADEKKAAQEKAYRAFQEAVKRYPGSDMINYRLGILAEELNRPEEAIAYLEAALDIERRYRAQFAVMYPHQQEVISRLGPSVYADLLKRLERLR